MKRVIDTLNALDFRRDDDASRPGKTVYWHPNSPDERLNIFHGATEPACISLICKAQKIADTGWTGPAMPRTIGERNAIRRNEQRRHRERDITAHAERGARAERRYQSWRAIETEERRQRELRQLMMPGR
ncbi:hypothetical protein DW322_11210 [Rhodococcus rhodnii]|uniref:Uncharacterized protein n=2 Tax=Rhodococcus rhodnii TaxID=38312 RepID=R7WRV7_9NOCA|nr:hypothetical protein [Rhodococcus rhodnii]EOM78053.1 hypothetical protein Rrhod_0594 [Rhodococcus rhodnii LMG 5362]TXG90680.1 hypothetical protein DW322_11210 [Rhodococcus rhodnii]